MKIAITYENEYVYQHFGHSQQFKLYVINDGVIAESKVLDTNGQGHGALAKLLKSWEVSTVICGGIGGGARNMLTEAGIELYSGVSGKADEIVTDYLNGKLSFNPNVQCGHHDHSHGSCGEQNGHSHNSCGEHR